MIAIISAEVPEAAEKEKLDELLIKISREGRENLTDEELELLNQASERLRRRKKGRRLQVVRQVQEYRFGWLRLGQRETLDFAHRGFPSVQPRPP